MRSPQSLRRVVIAPDLLGADEADDAVQAAFEQVAFKKLRTAPMDKGMRLGDVARRMLDVADLLG